MWRIWEGKQEGRTKERRITKQNNGATGVGRWMVRERGRDSKREEEEEEEEGEAAGRGKAKEFSEGGATRKGEWERR